MKRLKRFTCSNSKMLSDRSLIQAFIFSLHFKKPDINNPDGSFAGIFLTMLRVDYFTSFYAVFQMDELGNFVIALRDGTVLAHRPFDTGVIGTSLAKGEVIQDTFLMPLQVSLVAGCTGFWHCSVTSDRE